MGNEATAEPSSRVKRMPISPVLAARMSASMPIRRATSRAAPRMSTFCTSVTTLGEPLDDGGSPSAGGELMGQGGSGDTGAGDDGVASHEGRCLCDAAGQAVEPEGS